MWYNSSQRFLDSCSLFNLLSIAWISCLKPFSFGHQQCRCKKHVSRVCSSRVAQRRGNEGGTNTFSSLWAGIWGCAFELDLIYQSCFKKTTMACSYLHFSSLIFMSYQHYLQMILHLHFAHYSKQSFWLAFYIEIRIVHGQTVFC